MTSTRVTLAQQPTPTANPELAVTSVPFELGTQGHILVQADVSGHHGTFVLDTGWPGIGLNPAYLRRAVHGTGYDTVTAMSRDSADADMQKNPYGDTAEVTVRLGTFTIHVNRQNERPASQLPTVSHLFGLERGQQIESGLQRPILGFLGPNVLAQFETVVDYVHHQLIFIPIDTAGRRLVKVPAYVPATIVPLQRGGMHDLASGIIDKWYIEGRVGAIRLALHLDTGAAITYLTNESKDSVAAHTQDGGYDPIRGPQQQLDTLVLAGHAYMGVMFGPSPFGVNGLGFPFFRQCGVVGFNFRARQFLIYQQ